MQTYSVRRVLHGDEGVASRWAANVRPRDIAGIWFYAVGLGIVPPSYSNFCVVAAIFP